jgi:CHAT domain-containing protein/tetratricopeptide (TPR) repeat protein
MDKRSKNNGLPLFFTGTEKGSILFSVILFLICSQAYSKNPASNLDSVYLQKANIYFEIGQYDSAVLYFELFLRPSLQEWESCKGHQPQPCNYLEMSKLLRPIYLLGTSYCMTTDPLKALQLLTLGKQIIDSVYGMRNSLLPWFYYQIGNANLIANNYAKAISSFQGALSLVNEFHPLSAKVKQNLGGIYFFTEDYEKAMENFLGAWLLLKGNKKSDTAGKIALLINMGSSSSQLQDYHKSLGYYREAIQMLTAGDGYDPVVEARIRLNMGIVYTRMHNSLAAVKQFYLTKQMLGTLPSTRNERISLFRAIANHYKSENRADSTVMYLQMAMRLAQTRNVPDRMELAGIKREMATSLIAIKKYDKAKFYLEQAGFDLKQNRYADQMADTWHYDRLLWDIEDYRIKVSQAELYHKMALETNSKVQLLKAFGDYQNAIVKIEAINQGIARNGSRLIFNESAKTAYYGALETGYALTKVVDTIPISKLYRIIDQSKAKLLYNGYLERIAIQTAGIPDSLFLQQSRLLVRISESLSHASKSDEGIDQHNDERHRIYLSSLICDYQRLDSISATWKELFNTSPTRRPQPRTKEVAQLQGCLQSKEALLNYFVGDTSLFIHLLTSNTEKLFRISIGNEFREKVSEYVTSIRCADLTTFQQHSKLLYGSLISPVAQSLEGIEKLVIIPDDVLSTIPFETLISATKECRGYSSTPKVKYLIHDYDVVYHYSATLWADSLFHLPDTSRPVTYLGVAPVADLTNSRKEIEGVATIVEKYHGTADKLFSNDATKESFKESSSGCSIIHLATHGIINRNEPERSGLQFSPKKYDQKVDNQSNGLMLMNEIASLNINPDLLVLSACATGAGKTTASEGTIAITRGFFIAGSKNILYTLSNVTDKHSREFITSFFELVLSGVSYAKALRLVKIRTLEKPETSLPMIWAQFMLLGT